MEQKIIEVLAAFTLTKIELSKFNFLIFDALIFLMDMRQIRLLFYSNDFLPKRESILLRTLLLRDLSQCFGLSFNSKSFGSSLMT